MTFFLVLSVLIALAVLAPRFGVDSRRLTDRAGGPPDLLNDPPERQSDLARPPVRRTVRTQVWSRRRPASTS